MNLRDQGFRLLVCPSRKTAEWHHPSAVDCLLMAGWTDCTDMNDAQFHEFMGVTTA